MATARDDPGMAVLDGKLYAVGGYGYGMLASVERYDPVTNAWEAVAPLAVARDQPGVAVLDGKLYAAGGGRDENSAYLSSVEQYDAATNVWEGVAPMTSARARPCVVLL